jgi:hypothetical protein
MTIMTAPGFTIFATAIGHCGLDWGENLHRLRSGPVSHDRPCHKSCQIWPGRPQHTVVGHSGYAGGVQLTDTPSPGTLWGPGWGSVLLKVRRSGRLIARVRDDGPGRAWIQAPADVIADLPRQRISRALTAGRSTLHL